MANPNLANQTIEIISDSKMAVSWINDDGIGSIKFVNIVLDCRDFIKSHGGIFVSYNSRSTNSVADSLAKQGSSSAENFIQWSL